MMSEHDDLDDELAYPDDIQGQEEIRIANILLYGTPAAKQEIIIKLIYIGHIPALNSVLMAMSDAEYDRVMPLA